MNTDRPLKELADISFEAKKTQLKSLMVGGEEQPNTLMELVTSKGGTKSTDAWRLFSKAKNALEDGPRLENLAWQIPMDISPETNQLFQFNHQFASEPTSIPQASAASMPMSTNFNAQSVYYGGLSPPSNTTTNLVAFAPFSYPTISQQTMPFGSGSPLSLQGSLHSTVTPSGLGMSLSFPNGHGMDEDSLEVGSYSPHSGDGPTPIGIAPSRLRGDMSAFGIAPQVLQSLVSEPPQSPAGSSCSELPAEPNHSVAGSAPAASADQKICGNCSTTNTVLWRKNEQGTILCNACGLFFKLHGSNRPLRLKTDVIRKRNRKSKKDKDNQDDDDDLDKPASKPIRAPKAKSKSLKVATRKGSDLASTTPPVTAPAPVEVKSDYVSTGKRARPDTDVGQPYTNSETPFMYIPTKSSQYAQAQQPAVAQGGIDLVRAASYSSNMGSLSAATEQQDTAVPSSFTSHWSQAATQFSPPNSVYNHQLLNSSTFTPSFDFGNSTLVQQTMPSSVPVDFSAAPMNAFNGGAGMYVQQGGISQAQLDQLNKFQKQPVFHEQSKTSLLFHGNNPPDRHNRNDTSTTSNARFSDVLSMSQMMSTDDPAGRVTESMVDDLYDFTNRYDIGSSFSFNNTY
ncbi:hypothetical protein HDV03_000559 [Kappamyces sp. JEL0829]|nr:hypothetical protein HDV03_000559 [Kappamyces sp. JEL0829]